MACTSSTKSIHFVTSPPDATIVVNGKELDHTSPITADVPQQENLSVTAIKDGYEIASTLIPTRISLWRSWLWTRYDKDARYIDTDEVYLELNAIPTLEQYTEQGSPTDLPAYDPSVKLPLLPVLPAIYENEEA